MPGFQTVQMSGEIEPLITFVSSQRKAHTNSTSTFNFQSGDCNLSFSEQEMNPTVRRSRPNSTCEMRSHTREQSPSPARHIRDDNQAQAYSTVRRTSSPFRKPVNGEIGLHSRRPPLPRTHQTLDRPPLPPRADSVERGMTNTCHNPNLKLQDLPNFNHRLENMGKQAPNTLNRNQF